MSIFRSFLCAISCLIIVSCGGGGGSNTSFAPDPTPEPTPDGSVVFMEPQPNGNTFACGVCHALEEPIEGQFDRPGHPIGDALRRETFKNGVFTDFIDAANTCLESWIRLPLDQLWTDTTPEFLALTDFLQNRDTGSGVAPPLEFEKAVPLMFPTNDDVQGDAVAGREHFNQSCAICHGEDATGRNNGQRAPQLAGLYGFEGAGDFIARKVRQSGPPDDDIYPEPTVEGVMPFWAEDRISNEDLENVIEFIINSDEPAPEPVETPLPQPGGTCNSTHPNIGQTATLSTISHNVQGTATIIDDCTIRIDNFSFDGGGINIVIYGGNGDFISTGFSMSGNLLGQVFNNDTLTVTLPAGRTLDDIDRISVWCIPVRASFGDGIFQ